MSAELPPLPKPSVHAWADINERFLRANHYTAEQMRAYALAAVEAVQATPAPGAPGQEAAAVRKDSLTTQAAAVQAVGADAKDAARYRWLRLQNWHDSDMCIVVGPKTAVRLGSFCPSGLLLDQRIDFALASSGAGEKTS